MLGNRNNWYRREARRILIERRNSADAVALRKQFDESDGVRLLESFWTLHGMGYADNALLQRALTHASVPVRTWAVRFIGDAPSAPAEVASALVSRSRSDNSAVVRSQLAATARRLPAVLGMPVFRELLLRSDAGDPHIPLMLWWGLEARALEHRQLVKELFEQTAVWESPLVQQHILTRLARRYAAEGQPRDFDMCVELLRLAPGLKQVVRLLEGIELGLAGRNLDVAPPALQTWFQSAWPANSAQAAFIRLGVRLRHAESLAAALRRAQDRTVPDAERLPLIESLGQSGASDAALALLSVARENGSLNLRKAALGSLQPFSGPEIADQLLAVYPQLPRELQATVRQVLSARAVWAGALVNAAAAGTVQPSDISLDTLRQWLRHDNAELRTKIEKVWGRVQESSDDKKKAVNELRLVLRPSGTVGRTAKGELAAGKKVFLESCGQCHTLFGEGGAVGPDLTGIDRRNLDYLLTHIVDPSAFIRPEYVSYELMTRDDQMISGLIVEQNGNTITMVDRNQVRHQIARTELRQLNESKVSLMPEGLLEALAPQQVLDLFSYLQK
jgi:putative heme-binding domain-containing protein